MSLPNRPAFQKATKSSSSSSAAAASPSGRWNNLSAGVSPVRGLSPVRGSFNGIARQSIEGSRSHTNPLFTSRSSDICRTNTPTKISKDCKENREKQEPWKVPTEKAQYSGKTVCTTPGKTSRTTAPASMRFATPPKPVAKRKILAENREFSIAPPTTTEVDFQILPAPPPPPPSKTGEQQPRELHLPAVNVPPTRTDESQSIPDQEISANPSTEQQQRDAVDSDTGPRSPQPHVSIEDLQKRIQKFLQDEGTSADASEAPSSSPSRFLDGISNRRLSGSATGDENSSSSGIEDPPYHPVYAPYSPRPEFLRSRRSPTSSSAVEASFIGSEDGDGGVGQDRSTPTYDPRNNFLSPRPQFLRYRPLRRLELLRKSAESMLGELDLESPATDSSKLDSETTDSSKLGSEKEDGESQDPQEVQSLKSSSSPCLGASSSKLHSKQFSSEIAQQRNPGEIQTELDGSLPPPQCVEIFSGAGAGGVEADVEDEEEWVEGENGSTSRILRGIGVVSLLAFVFLVLLVSGSPALLPISLHQNHLSNLWRTSEFTQPVRQLTKHTEGLWAASNPNEYTVSVPSVDLIRVGFVHLGNGMRSVDSQHVARIGNAVWSWSRRFSAGLGEKVVAAYGSVRNLLENDSEYSRSSEMQEVNEWDWVPDYEFVVPRDVFDPTEAYEKIRGRLESWNVQSWWASVIGFLPYNNYGKSLTSRQEGMDEKFVRSSEIGNSSQCVIGTEMAKKQITGHIRPPTPADNGLLDSSAFRAQKLSTEGSFVELSAGREIAITQYRLGQSIAEMSVVEPLMTVLQAQGSPQSDSQVHDGSPVEEMVVDSQVNPSKVFQEPVLSHVVDQIQDSKSTLSEDGTVSTHPQMPGEIGSGFVGKTEVLSYASHTVGSGLAHIPEKLSEELTISSSHTLETFSSTVHLPGESTNMVVGEAEGSSVSHPIEHGTASNVPDQLTQHDLSQEQNVLVPEAPFQAPGENLNLLHMGPKATLSTFLQKLRPAPTLQTAAVGIFSLLLLAGASLLMFQRMTAGSGTKDRMSSLNISSPHGFSPQRSPKPRYEVNSFQPLFETVSSFPALFERVNSTQPLFERANSSQPLFERVNASQPLFERVNASQPRFERVSPAEPHFERCARTSLDYAGQFSASSAAPELTPSLYTPAESFPSPELPSKYANDDASPGMEIVEDSSLGRFTALLPVVQKEGTEKEKVKLTPVRRSSRIRTRMQSPCSSLHPHHLCNC